MGFQWVFCWSVEYRLENGQEPTRKDNIRYNPTDKRSAMGETRSIFRKGVRGEQQVLYQKSNAHDV